MIYVIVGPSGAGKTTFINLLLEQFDDIKVINVDVCTHSERDYKNNPGRTLTDMVVFENNVKHGAYSIINNYNGNKYGYCLPSNKNDESNKYILDYPGEYPDCIELYGYQWLGILLLPPSEEELGNRLRNSNRYDRIKSAISIYKECLDDIASGKMKDKWLIIINDTFDTLVSSIGKLQDWEFN